MSFRKIIDRLKRIFGGRGIAADLKRNQEAADRLDRAVKEVLSR